MEANWDDYLDEIDIGNPFRTRIQEILDFYKNKLDIEPEDIFVSDESSSRIGDHKSLWLFSQKYACEAKNFPSEEVYDCTVIEHNIRFWELVSVRALDEVLNEQSKLRITIVFKDDNNGVLVASGKNCKKLLQILSKYITVNLC